MSLLEKFIAKAKKNPKIIVFPEGEDERILKAAVQAAREGIAFPLLLGEEDKIASRARALNLKLDGVKAKDPQIECENEEYTNFYHTLRKDRFFSPKMARALLRKPLNLGALMVKCGEARGMVAGAANLTSSVLKSSMLMIGLNKGTKVPSSFFIMSTREPRVGERGVLIFADAAVNPDPSSEQLADIALTTADSVERLLSWQPRVALLSFSTKKSTAHPLVDKVIEAVKLTKERASHLLIDGDLQVDAALIPEIAQRKVRGSKVAGRANVLIFPNLDAANIAYKLVQYLGGAKAYGPILQGFSHPVNDLSRGAKVEDILALTAITVILAQESGIQ
ncbi:phosphate acetyltransferase [Candidatus Aerophobetes bacterium]|uniref:Phosphate acetyltransferase n=1 Tax=Aerophobetes bacterium TaxID=2030807 RepID=A0A523RTD7_UNCAE|nr:MAG: phosphate acetyltransferase [Candidatus Aerophobetes bacterium]